MGRIHSTTIQNSFSISIFLHLLISCVLCENEFDVLSITDVPLPSSSDAAASFSAPYDKEIPEFTLCFRFLITFYNQGWITLFHAQKKGTREGDNQYYKEQIEFQSGVEYQGYQTITSYLRRNIPGGGLGGRSYPIYIGGSLQRKVQVGKWSHMCSTYNSKLHKRLIVYNGLRASIYNYTDSIEEPMPAGMFEMVKLGMNMRGLFTDLHIFNKSFSEEEMVDWTSSCQKRQGEIFSWHINKVNLPNESQINVTFIKKSKSDVCPDPDIKFLKMDEPSRMGADTESTRFKPSFTEENPTFIGKVLEIITDPYPKSYFEARDRCYRLAGEIMPIPQTEEEERLMDKTQWDFMMKKVDNNVTFLDDNLKVVILWVGGESSKDDLLEVFPNMEKRILARESLVPDIPYLKYYHPTSGVLISPRKPMLAPVHFDTIGIVQYCNVCYNSLNKPIPDHDTLYRNTPICFKNWCTDSVSASFVCIFQDEPTYSVRGLCKEAVMDTKYKLGDHKPMDRSLDLAYSEWGNDNTRNFVGPKGWTITRDPTDKMWRMEHSSYKELTLTMLDTDALPIGRHLWKVENNVCRQGKTSEETLLISGCREDQFTCDDGKCLNITQRCDNIEVNFIKSSIFYKKEFSK